MGGKEVLPPAFQYIPSMLASYDWRLRHAGLMAIAAIGEGTSKVRLTSYYSSICFSQLDLGNATRTWQSRRVRNPFRCFVYAPLNDVSTAS